MKQKISWILMVCTLCLLGVTACIDHEPECDVCDEQPEGRGVWLSFNMDEEAQTRSTLHSSEIDYKDVKEVYLYVFEGNTADATCVLATPVGWKGEITQKHWISADLKPNVEHTFLAVGVDDQSEVVYGFPTSIVANQTKLGECMAKLQRVRDAQHETEEEYLAKCKDDLAHAQFFVGTTIRKVAGEVVEVALTLRRKVAGILVYLRNIPVNAVHKNTSCRVNTLEVRLHQPQHTSLKLYKTGNVPVFGEGTLTSSEVLFALDLAAGNTSGFTPDSENRYFTKAGNDSVLADSYLAGAYLLPMKAAAGSATLSVNLRGDYTDGSGNVEKNTVLKTYEVRYKDSKTGTLSTDFDVKENTLYSIGKKLSNSSTSGDKPADLSGNLLLLEVMPWDTVKVDNTFPTVTGPARIEANFNDEKMVYDASLQSFVITIKPAVDKNPDVKKPWTLSVNYAQGNTAFGEKPSDWIHFESYDSQGNQVEHTNMLTGYGEQEVTVVLNDYAVKRDLPANHVYTATEVAKFKNDIRRATLELRTEGVTNPYTLQVQQYNTLTIYSRGKKGGGSGYRGISRLDYGCSFNTETGEVVESGTTQIGWGYYETGNLYVSGDQPMNYVDGEDTSDKCYNRWKKGATGSGAYMYSAIERLTRRFRRLETVTENGGEKVVDRNPANVDDHTKEKNWYLPAYYEMWGVSETFGNHYADFGMTLDKAYWTSSGDDGWYKDAYIAKIGVAESSMQRDKDNLYHARPMIHFD